MVFRGAPVGALTRFLYPVPADRRLRSIILWWERRRPAYNAVVGATGLGTLVVANVLSHLPPYGHGLIPPPAVILVYGLLANACYTLGWLLEGAGQLTFGETLEPAGPVLFRQGLIFSVGLTILPIGLALAEWGIRILRFLW
jgi:hypothetical protein